MENVKNYNVEFGRGGLRVGRTQLGDYVLRRSSKIGPEEEPQSRSACVYTLLRELDKIPNTGYHDYDDSIDYTNNLNHWITHVNYDIISETTKSYSSRGGPRDPWFEHRNIIRFNTNMGGSVIFNASGAASSKKEAKRRAAYATLLQVRDLELDEPVIDSAIPQESNQDGDDVCGIGLPVMMSDHFRSEKYFNQVINHQLTLTEPININDNQQYPLDLNLYNQLDVSKIDLSVNNQNNDNQVLDNKEDAPRVQMDNETSVKTTEQGEPTQESDKQINTIITRDQQETLSSHTGPLDNMLRVVSTEPTHEFNSIVSRWMALPGFLVSVNDKRLAPDATPPMLKVYNIPGDLYADKDSPNLIPFSAFVYGRMEVEFRVVINANKFHAGKLMVSTKYDTYRDELYHSGYQTALQRNHVIMDMCANNEARITLPFRYHRPLMRLVNNSSATVGVKPALFGQLQFHVLSVLNVGADAPTDIGVRVFFRFNRAEYTAMSYSVPIVQMMRVEDYISPRTAMSMKELLSGAERAFAQLGSSRNQDKPSDISITSVVPHPRSGFQSGKGLMDVVPLRLNPHTLTNYNNINIPTDEPKNYQQLARIYGLYKYFDWSNTAAEGSELIKFTVDPTMRSYVSLYTGEPTPLEYAMSNFNFWSGTIEMRIDFVSTAFHTGAVQISVEYGRQNTDEMGSSSTYIKVFHLGDQKTVDFTIPYIYDTVQRRSTAVVYDPYLGIAGTDQLKWDSTTIAPESRTIVRVRVINVLRPVQGVANTIECLVYIRAGPNFTMRGLKSNSLYVQARNITDAFPQNYNQVTKTVSNDFNIVKKSTIAQARKHIREYKDKLAAKKQQEAAQAVKKEDPVIKHEFHEADKYLQKIYDDQAKYATENREAYAHLETKIDEIVTAAKEAGKKVPKPGTSKPRTQMDNGEKEDQDVTNDFGVGVPTDTLVTNDGQMDFKDLLRRPTLLIWREEVTPLSVGGYFIPVMVPSYNMSCVITGDDTPTATPNSIWAPSLHLTTTVNILNMFRCWRGSVRYTFVFYGMGDPTSPIYISYIPHSGTRLLGMRDMRADATFDVPVPGSNFITEMVIPVVNPSITVEIPYETENTWSLIHEDDAERNYSWRDKGDLNVGHIVVTTHGKVQMDVFWSAGDDFEFANFYGAPVSASYSFRYRWNDTKARVQMDEEEQQGFNVLHPITSVNRVLQRNVNKVRELTWNVAESTVEGLPVVRKAEEAITKVNEVTTRVDECARKFGIAIEAVQSLLDETLTKLTERITGITEWTNIVYNTILDILIVWVDKSWTAVAVGVVRFITTYLGRTIKCGLDALHAYIPRLAAMLTSIFGTTTTQTVVLQLDEQDQVFSSYAAILVGLIGTAIGVAIKKPVSFKQYAYMFTERMTSTPGVAYFVQVMAFIKGTFSMIKDLVLYAFGLVNPEVRALQMLSEQNALVKEFVKEAQIMTSEVNANQLGRPEHRNRLWRTILRAYQLQRIITQVPNKNYVSSQLMKLCTDVIKYGNEHFVDLAACPVRYEPMVIVLEGDAGVGKSYFVDRLVDTLLGSIEHNTRSSEHIYWRTAGQPFWSGYRDQPVVVFDEWMNTASQDVSIQQCTELLSLKSTSVFIPPMAHLDDKRIRGNPLLVIILTNDAFPNLNTAVNKPAAILRRREIIFHMQRTAAYQGVDLKMARGAVREGVARDEHIEFQIYDDVRISRSKNPNRATVAQALGYATSYFRAYHFRELEEVDRRMKRLPGYIAANAPIDKIYDPFSMFYNLGAQYVQEVEIERHGYTHFEELEDLVRQVAEGLVQSIPNAVENEQPPEVIEWAELLAQDGGAVEPQICPELIAISKWFILPAITHMLEAGYINRILYATRRQLKAWYTACARKSNEFFRGQCCVCQGSEIPIYMCYNSLRLEDANRHFMCQACAIGVETAANGNRVGIQCPVCRCVYMVPAISKAITSKWTVMAKMVHSGMISIMELEECMIQFTRTVPAHKRFVLWSALTLAPDLYYLRTGVRLFGPVMESSLVTAGAIGTIHASYKVTDDVLTRIRKAVDRDGHIHTMADVQGEMDDESHLEQRQQPVPTVPEPQPSTSGMQFRSNPWDVNNIELPPIGRIRTLPEYEGRLKPIVNDQVFDDFMTNGADNRVCLHDILFTLWDNASVAPDGVTWQVIDPTTSVIIDISMRKCKNNCVLDSLEQRERYRGIIEKYLRAHSQQYWAFYIQYYNKYDINTLRGVPLIYRRDFMIEEVEEILKKPWYECISDYCSEHRRAITVLVGVVAFAATAYGLSNTVTQLLGITALTTQVSGVLGSGETGPRHAMKKITTRRGLERRAYFHSSEENTHYDVAVNKIARNTVRLTIHKDNKIILEMYGTGLRDNILLMPRHYVKSLRRHVANGAIVKACPIIASVGFEHAIEISDDTVVESDVTDLAYLLLPRKYPPMKDITSMIATHDDFEKVLPSTVYMIANPKARKGSFLTELELECRGLRSSLSVGSSGQDPSFVVEDVLVYNYSRNGVCGSMILRENSTRPILGMHFAGMGEGTSGEGYAIPITRESLVNVEGRFKNKPRQMEDVMYGTIEEATMVQSEDCFVSYYGSVPKELTPFTNDKSKLEKSSIYGYPGLETVMEPAILSKRDDRYKYETTPLYEGMRKHGIITEDFPVRWVEKAREGYYDLCIATMKPVVATVKVLTDEQAIVGLPTNPNYQPMDLTTSAGYPWNLDSRKSTKESYIIPRRDETLQAIGVEWIDPAVTEEMQRKRILRQQGIIPHTIFLDALKDEKKGPASIAKRGGTRVVCGSPIDYTIECRKYFMHFVAAFMDQRHKLMHAFGCNPMGPEWGIMARKLLLKNDRFCTIDYANFGPGYNSNVAEAAYAIIIRWTMENVRNPDGTELDERYLWCLAYECINSMHICHNTIYQQGAGSPSGAFFTTTVNTIVNILYLMIAWDQLTKDVRTPTAFANVEFYEHVQLYTYGDDALFSVSPLYFQQYNTRTITEFFKKYKITATDADKGDEIRESLPWNEATFLKRGFRLHPKRKGEFLAPLRIESIKSTTQWIWKSPNKKLSTKMNAQSSLMEAYGHGPDWFASYKTVLNQALIKAKVGALTGTWEEYDETMFGTGYDFDINGAILNKMTL